MSLSPNTCRFSGQRNAYDLQKLLPSLPGQDSSSKPRHRDASPSKPSNTDTSSSKPSTTNTSPSKPSSTDMSSSKPSTTDKSFSKPSNTNISPSKPPHTDKNTLCSEVAAVLNLFQLHKVGKLPSQQWQKFSLSRAGYYKLQEALQYDLDLKGYVECKIRYDYFPFYQELVIRMNTPIHELLIRDVVNEVMTQLNRFGSGQSPSADFARHIEDLRHTCLKPLDTDYGPHAPDTSFAHCASASPGVVLEVSYAQKRKDLPRLVDDYLLGSNGNIQVVIGLDLEYRGSKAAFSVWKLATRVNPSNSSLFWEVEQVIVDEMFRGSGINPSAGLQIPLADFANSTVRAQYLQPIVGNVYISTSKLCSFLVAAEARYSVFKSGSNNMPLPQGMGKKPREATPPEELLKAHEDKFEDDELCALKMIEAQNSSFDDI